MALTSGAKKFFGLLLTVAIVGGGIYGYKSYSASHPTPVSIAAEITEAPAQASEPIKIPQPMNSPIAQASNVERVVDQIAPEPAPATTPATSTTSSDRGMANLMQAGNRK